MKKLTLFLTLSLLTIIGTSTIVKAEENQPNNVDANAVKIPNEEANDAEVEPLEPEGQHIESNVMTGQEKAEEGAEGVVEPSAQEPGSEQDLEQN